MILTLLAIIGAISLGLLGAWGTLSLIRIVQIRHAIKKQREQEDRIFAANIRAVLREQQERHLCLKNHS